MSWQVLRARQLQGIRGAADLYRGAVARSAEATRAGVAAPRPPARRGVVFMTVPVMVDSGAY